MQRIPLLTALTLLAAGLLAWQMPSFTFDDDGKIWVEGTSSVHDWECQVPQFAGAVEAALEAQDVAALSGTTLSVPVQGIDCDNGTMNKKVGKALGDSPISYTLTGATLGAPEAEGWITIDTQGTLTIAETSRPVQLTVKGKALDDGRLRFTGQHTLKMTDYGVDPPTALLGTLKTGDEVTVHFDVTASR